MYSIFWVLVSFIGGAAAFWAPDVLIRAIYRGPNTPVSEIVITAACPAALCIFFIVVLRYRRGESNGPSTGAFALLGVWFLGLTFMMLARTFGGGGFSDFPRDGGLISFFVVSSLMPTRTFVFSMLEGAAGALVTGSVAAFVCFLRFEKGRWVIPRAT